MSRQPRPSHSVGTALTNAPRRPRRTVREVMLSPLVRPILAALQLSRRSQFEAIGPCVDHVVFLGDSITEGGIWNEWFPGVACSNRGIAGETTAQVLTRLDTAIDHPRAVFLLIGTNDLAAAVPVETITRNIAAILDGIESRSPKTRVYVQSVMPRAVEYQPLVQFLNVELVALVDSRSDLVTYLDLWPALSTPAGALKPDYTGDKLHLNGAGYRAWTEAIRPFVSDAATGR